MLALKFLLILICLIFRLQVCFNLYYEIWNVYCSTIVARTQVCIDRWPLREWTVKWKSVCCAWPAPRMLVFKMLWVAPYRIRFYFGGIAHMKIEFIALTIYIGPPNGAVGHWIWTVMSIYRVHILRLWPPCEVPISFSASSVAYSKRNCQKSVIGIFGSGNFISDQNCIKLT